MKVEIRTDEKLSTMGTQVFIDGEKVEMLRDVQFEHFVGDVPRVTITFIPEHLTVVGSALVEAVRLEESSKVKGVE